MTKLKSVIPQRKLDQMGKPVGRVTMRKKNFFKLFRQKTIDFDRNAVDYDINSLD